MTRAVLLGALALAMLAYAGGVVVFYIWPDGVAVEYNATAPSPVAFNYTAVINCTTGVGRAVLRAGDAYVVVGLPEGNATAWPPAAVEFARRLIPTVPKNSTGTLVVEITAKNGTAYARYRGCKVAANPADPRTHWWAVLYYVTLLRNVNFTTARFVGVGNVTVSPTEIPFSAIGTFGFWLNITLPGIKPKIPENKTEIPAPPNATTVQTPTNATSTPTVTVVQTPTNITTTTEVLATSTTFTTVVEPTPVSGVTPITPTAQEAGSGDAIVKAALLVALAAALIIAAVALKKLKR